MKRVIALLMVAMLLTTCVPTTMAAYSSSNTTAVYGDVNRDCKINLRDVGLIQQYLAGWSVSLDTSAADVNADSKVNLRDVGLLQQYLAGWKVTLGPKVPAVEFPAAGYDFDGKGRIVVEAIEQHADVLMITITNLTSQWMIPEYSHIDYTCTDAEGNVLSREDQDKYYGYIFPGALEAKRSVVVTVILPEGTAKFQFKKVEFDYWTQWSYL